MHFFGSAHELFWNESLININDALMDAFGDAQFLRAAQIYQVNKNMTKLI